MVRCGWVSIGQIKNCHMVLQHSRIILVRSLSDSFARSGRDFEEGGRGGAEAFFSTLSFSLRQLNPRILVGNPLVFSLSLEERNQSCSTAKHLECVICFELVEQAHARVLLRMRRRKHAAACIQR